ncbi:MAG: hypothetical protein OXE95_03190 [Chloroflexi bacterium]|nr:hypothetical protein [Chloroflexota bacterium]MCY4246567.1 hypothetical protein [Chloroflexota bacterium]
MPVDIGKARDFVYRQGSVFERALFAWLFDDGSLERLQQVILCYKNPDGGFGHGFEHDLKAPQSNPLALEYLLGVMKRCGIPAGRLLDGTAAWVEAQMGADGALRNPPQTREYPLAPWWQESGGQTLPDSIVGNLMRFNRATPTLVERTKSWALDNVTIESIKANDWLFMAYHAYDFFFAIDDFPALADYRRATIDNIIACARALPDSQVDSLFAFTPAPGSLVACALPPGILERCLDRLASAQQSAGHWRDQHELPQWYPITTINALVALRRYDRC